MTTEYTRSLLRVALAQICQNLGWNSIHSTPLEILTDVLERYIKNLGVYSHRYSEQFGRVEPNLDDLTLAFQEMGVNLSELSDFMKHIDPVPFAFDVPRFPIRRPNLLNFPKPNSRELFEREEHVHDHMPTMHPGWDEEIMDTGGGDAMTVDGASGAEKRAATTPGEDEPSSKRLKSRVYPEEAAPSSYVMKGVKLSESGDILGQGKLPEPNAPPPPTPTTPMLKTPFRTPLAPKPPVETPVPSDDVSSVKDEVDIKTEPVEIIPKSPRPVGRPPKSPKVSTSETPKSGFMEKKRGPGRPFKKSPGRPAKIAKSPGRPPKSPGRPPKSPGRPPKSPGRPPKSPGRPPKSPFQSPARSPGRPPKSPGAGARSPGRSPLSSPLSPRSPGAVGRGKSPGRPPKSPGRGRGRPPKSPGRPPLVAKKDSPRLPQSPVGHYFSTGELPIGTTKAQLKQQPVQSPPRKKSSKPYKPVDSVQKIDFNSSQSVADDIPPGVTVETVEVITTTEKSPEKSKREKLKKPIASIDEAIAAVIKQGEAEDKETKESKDDADAQREKEEKLREKLRQEEKKDQEKKTQEDTSGRVTPDWIRQQAAEMDKLRKEDKAKPLTDIFPPSPSLDFKRVDSPKEKTKSKKEKKKDKKKKKHKDLDSDRDRHSKKEKRLEEKLRERFRETSQSSSSPERAPPVERADVVPTLRIGIGKQFTIKPMAEDSDKETTKKPKKDKKKKDKDRDRERDVDDKERKKKKDKERAKKEKEGEDSVPKLTFKFGGQGKVFITPTESPRESPKRDIPKLVIKQREDSPEKRVVAKISKPSRSPSPSPTRSPIPPLRHRSPPRKAAPLSPVRFTPSPESNPKTPSIGSPFNFPSPTRSRSISPAKHYSPRDRSLSPVKTPSLAPASPSSSASPPPRILMGDRDIIPPLPPSSKGGKGAVFAETQGTIIGENGEIIWICPACTLADDGSPMIGCDVCDDWYHWECVGITQEPPEDESWYCPKHRHSEPPRKSSSRGSGRGRGRGRGRKKKSLG